LVEQASPVTLRHKERVIIRALKGEKCSGRGEMLRLGRPNSSQRHTIPAPYLTELGGVLLSDGKDGGSGLDGIKERHLARGKLSANEKGILRPMLPPDVRKLAEPGWRRRKKSRRVRENLDVFRRQAGKRVCTA
jgi:hypothetical protein